MIRIVNKTGIINDTEIIDTDTGNKIKCVKGVEILPFSANDDDLIQIKLTLARAEIDITGKVLKE